MVPDTASRPPVSAVPSMSPQDDAYAERWRQWQHHNAVTSRREARRAHVAFTILFAGVCVWLGLQLLGLPLWS
jgi:hypothetical protein